VKMTSPAKLEKLVSSEPELVMRNILEAISGKPYEKELDIKIIKDFVANMKYCGAKSGLDQEATDKCILTQSLHTIASNELLPKEEVKKRIDGVGLEKLAKKVGKAIEKTEKQIKDREKEELLNLFS